MSQYVDLAVVKTALGLTDVSLDTDLTRMIVTASAEINRICRRSFDPVAADVTVAQVYAAPLGSRLLIDDARTVTAVTCYGDALTGSDWMPLGTPAIRALSRRSPTNRALPWTTGADPGESPLDQIVVEAAWGWPATPDEIVQAAEMLTCHLWGLREQHYSDLGGFNQVGQRNMRGGLVPPRIETLLTPFIRAARVQIVEG